MFTPQASALELRDGAVIRRCRCVEIQPQDGSSPIRKTDWDRPVWIGSREFEPIGGVDVQASRHESGIVDPSTEIRILLTESGITDEALLRQTFADATVSVLVVDPWFPNAGPLNEATYRLTDSKNTGVTADLALAGTWSAIHERRIGKVVSPDCEHELYEGQCGRDISREQFTVPSLVVSRVVSRHEFDVALPVWNISTHTIGSPHIVQTATPHGLVTGALTRGRLRDVVAVPSGEDINQQWLLRAISADEFEILLFSGSPKDTTGSSQTGGTVQIEAEDLRYQYGFAVWSGVPDVTSDRNGGLRSRIRYSTPATSASGPATMTIVLDGDTPLPITVGDLVDAESGCNHLISDCKDVFFNFENYGGEEFVPGIERQIDVPSLP